ncbi:MAG: ribosome-recycling factor, partial [Holophagaceae bacterium]
MNTLDNVLQDTKKKMRASIEMLKKEMATVRTGRANASILDSVQVEYYGSMLPINQMGNVSVPEGSLLVITPFDKTAIKAIELAIQKSGLG